MMWQPPTPHAPCLDTRLPGVAPAGKSGKLHYNLTSELQALCSRGSMPVHVQFTGAICDGAGNIEWSTMRTVDPAQGLNATDCNWTRADDPGDVPGFFGACGVSPTNVLLPVRAC